MSSVGTNYTLPGRLGDPSLRLTTDPRLDPGIKQFLERLGLDKEQTTNISDHSIDTLKPIVAAMNDGFQALYDNIAIELPEDATEPEVVETSEMIPSFDGTELKLTYFRRADKVGQMTPAVLYSHGGGMTIINSYNPVHVRWCRSLAIAGLTTILVDYRNAYLASAHHPFPTGLNDCAAALDHVHDNKARLGISKIILQGESGGANLAIATALKAKRDGKIDRVAGVHGYVPYISNAYHWSEERKLKELPSLVECDGYILDNRNTAALGYYYGPNDIENPHAWPYHASVADLKGLPPHALTMDELDPLRDEGIAYHRKLLKAGVKSSATVGLGTTHGGRIMFRHAVPEFYNALVDEVVAFVNRL